jgi:methyl-accepting chemotaxis protein
MPLEAARAGDKGRGFNIVAKEIRKFSNDTMTSTVQISNTLMEMQKSIEEIQKLAENVVLVGRNQALSTEEIALFVDEIENMSKRSKKIRVRVIIHFVRHHRVWCFYLVVGRKLSEI